MATNPAQQLKEPSRVWRFAGCEFDELANQLLVRGVRANLEAKPIEVLRQLLLHPGEVVTKEELLDTVWPGLAVADGSLATAISKLRKTLADESIILTVPRIGYRLAVPVQTSGSVAPAGPELHMAGQTPVPGRESWLLEKRLDLSPSSEVWLARHPKTGELRVFKFAADRARLRALKREVTLVRLLRESLGERPDFVRVLEWNFERSPYFIESEFAGPNLLDWAKARGGLANVALDTRLKLLADVAEAVAAAHSLGVLHKDLKPANLLVAGTPDAPRIKVADFGSASLLEPSRLAALAITNAGFTLPEQADEVSGTVMYLAPEVLAGRSPSPASDVYALGLLLFQFVTGDLRKPLSPGWEHEIDDPLLRDDIAAAAAGNPARRLASAEEFARRLRTIEERRAQRARLERHEQRHRTGAIMRARLPWMLIAVAALLFAFAVTRNIRRRPAPDASHPAAVAVLPFQSPGNTALDPERMAVADEITTTLTHMRPLIVRTAAIRQDAAPPDPKKAAADLAVDGIVTGHLVRVGNELQVTIEATDANTNTVVWRDTVNVPAGDLLALQAQVSAIARNKLAPALGAPDFIGDAPPPPQNAKAYELYLRSKFPTTDPGPTKAAVSMLEKSVALDPTYAPAWAELSGRLYGASRFAGGGRALLDQSDRAAERAIALDPENVDIASELVLHRTERGDLADAMRQASELLRRRPDNANLHFLLSYVDRYAGLLPDSVAECNLAIQLDPKNKWSACSATFMQVRDYALAWNQLRPHLASEWSRARGIDILMRQGKIDEAMRLNPPSIPGWNSYPMLRACASGAPDSRIASLASKVHPDDDPEVSYLSASYLAYCGQTAAAVRLLKTAVAGHYCSYPAMDLDPLFDKIRNDARFLQVRQAAIACQAESLRIAQRLHPQ